MITEKEKTQKKTTKAPKKPTSVREKPGLKQVQTSKKKSSDKNFSIAEDKILRIVLKSYDHYQLDVAVKNIIEIASSTGAIVHGPIPLPRRVRVDTVLSSPHIDKRARDQFMTITYKRLIDIKYASTATLDALVNLELAAGVEVPQITVI